MKKFFKKTISISVGTKIMLCITSLVVLIAFFLSYISFFQSRNTLDKLTRDYLTARTKDSASFITRELENKITEIHNISELPEIQSMNWELQHDVLLHEIEKWNFDNLFIMDMDGIAYLADTNKTTDLSKEDFFIKASKGEPFITEPFIKQNEKESIITLTYPIKDNNGKMIGTICGTLDLKNVNKIVQDVKVGKTGYAFLLNKSGQYVAHKNMDLVFNETNIVSSSKKDSSLKELVKKMGEGISNIEIYSLDGKDTFVAYTPVSGTPWSLGLTVTKEEIMYDSVKTGINQIIISLFTIIVGIFVSLFIKNNISKELFNIKKYASELSSCNLTYIGKSIKNDDFGHVINSLNESVYSLNNAMTLVKDESNKIFSSSNEMDNMLISISEEIEKVVESIAEISANMQESASALQETSAMCQTVNDNTKSCVIKATEGLNLANKIELDASDIHEETLKSKKHIKKIYINASHDLRTSLNKVKVVENISDMANSILDISKQTNLLSLNAAIEAARAGEDGKGFTIVANEITKLAQQSTESVNNIQLVITEVLKAVKELSSSSSYLLDVLEKDIIKNYDNVINITLNYKNAGITFKDITSNFTNNSNDISESVEQISSAIEDLTSSISSVTDYSNLITENIMNISNKNNLILNKSHKNKKASKTLSYLVDKFKI
ncbi:methyl-accepting chemotaxis protein [Clostridium weizhouense]|uniref:Methyl-accepting chemotaxis protein n=1 Tax=Clostridium weizhouense TaxID=2859781 RepID=A0ABS7AS78_9CLOT|nr:methyl-accepting chemotaxis protein [Clostridium weizhouense]MBW6411516.1 methyl-accepting chemotaxis protein [Clostridium weizhouense]